MDSTITKSERAIMSSYVVKETVAIFRQGKLLGDDAKGRGAQ